MRAMLLERPGPISSQPLRAAEISTPEPGPGEVAIAIAACAVCRTDLQLSEGDLPLHKSPIIPGHQAIGRILALGPGVGAFGIGDRVGIGWLGYACGTCRYCLAGKENLCEKA